jgi:predicted dehydrogenase
VVLSFAHSPIRELHAVGLPVLSKKVDIANVRIEFESGCVANFTASRVSTERVRKLRFFQPKQYISVDYGRQDVLVFSVGKQISAAPALPAVTSEVSAELAAARQLFSGAAVLAQAGISMSKPPVAQEEPLKAEMKTFLQAVRERSRPEVSLEDGRRALALGLEILAQVQLHTEKFGIRG